MLIVILFYVQPDVQEHTAEKKELKATLKHRKCMECKPNNQH
jgi:hypothetical protein